MSHWCPAINFFLADDNILKWIVVVGVQFCEFTKKSFNCTL
jgi:hypothetical protein